MDRYVRVDQAKPAEPIPEDEVRIIAAGKMRAYITQATTMLTESHEKIVLKARLAPGTMIMVDTARGVFLDDEKIKSELAKQASEEGY